MKLFTIGMSIDTALRNEIEERVEVISKVFDLDELAGNKQTFNFSALKKSLALELTTGETYGLAFHRESQQARFLTAIAALMGYLTSNFHYLIVLDGGWDRKAGKFVYHIEQVDYLHNI